MVVLQYPVEIDVRVVTVERLLFPWSQLARLVRLVGQQDVDSRWLRRQRRAARLLYL